VEVAAREAEAGANVGAPAPRRGVEGLGRLSAPPGDEAVSAAVRGGLAPFNALSDGEAASALGACCACGRWTAAVTAARPFDDVADLHRFAAAQLAALDWSDIQEALAAHPRIGERAAGAGRDATWSRAEQAGAAQADARTAAALAAANAAYEARFGHVYLIRATGRTAPQLLAAALGRLEHDEPTEQAVVRDELSQIVRLRLDKLLLGLAEGTRSGW
jgi:2-oxo-4-hydroxy-4-carboxy-5-ureidoimidazoline decarboxylase